MQDLINKYEKVITDVDTDIKEAERFIKDLYDDYDYLDEKSKEAKECINLDERLKLQSMILKISDLVSSKREQKVELERQLLEIKKAAEKNE